MLYAIAKYVAPEGYPRNQSSKIRASTIILPSSRSDSQPAILLPLAPSPPPVPPRLVLRVPMRHRLPNLRLTSVIHAGPGPTPRAPIPLHHTPPPRTPRIRLLIHGKRAARRHRFSYRVSPPLAHHARTPRRRRRARAHIRAHGPLASPLAIAGLGRRRAFDIVVRIRVFSRELALQTPQRCFRQDLDRVCVAPLDAPVDLWVGGALAVRPVVDDQLVAVGQGARFVVAAVQLPWALKPEASADAGVDVFVCLAQGAVCCAAREGIDGVVLAGGANLEFHVSKRVWLAGRWDVVFVGENVLFVRPRP
jgi:hypothetical protein